MADITSPKNALIRCIQDDPLLLKPKVVFLIGNGAIKNGTSPLNMALKETPVLSDDTINVAEFNKLNFDHKLAVISFFLRLYRDESLNPCKTPRRSIAARRLMKTYQNTRMNIAAKYCLMKTSMSLHKLHRKCPLKLDVATSAVITTNWDETLWNDGSIQNILQLHGRCSIWESMIFPTELTQDEAIVDATLTYSKMLAPGLPHKELRLSLLRQLIAKKYGRGPVITHLRNAHRVAIQWLEEAEQLVIWGLKGNVYDAELLSTVVSSHVQNYPKAKVYIINPNSVDRDTIASLFRISSPVRIDIDPQCIF
jgi:hypothetical protein